MAVTPVRTGPLPTSSFPSPLINRAVSDFDAGDIGNGIEGAWRSVEWNAEIAGADDFGFWRGRISVRGRPGAEEDRSKRQ